ncbi:glycosyltransferase family 4 protein [Bdellovibrio bacteriovorus]|uniref:glycosyltransferase family 4 protein n=1 Tax=Bdellovibrio bacteriovorus TaxID=959 RepID=UPI0035A94EEF
MKETVVLSLYGVTEFEKNSLRNAVGDSLDFVSAGSLRASSPLGIIRNLRNLKARRLIIMFDSKNSLGILQILKLLGILTRSRELYVWIGDKEVPFKRSEIVRIVVSFLLQNVKSWASLLRNWLAVNHLEKVSSLNFKVSPKDQRIFYLKTNYWVGVKAGGSVGHIAGVIKGFLDNKFSVNYYGADKPLLVDDLIPYRVSSPEVSLSYPEELNHYSYDYQLFKELKNDPVLKDSDFIYQRMSIANFTGVRLSRVLKKPLILEYNGSEAWISKNWGVPLRFNSLADRIEKMCFKHAHRIVTVSNVLREDLIERGANPEKIVVYPNCIDPDIFNPALYADREKETLRKRWGINKDDKVFTFVGTFGKWHGVRILAEAVRELYDKNADFLDQNKVKFWMIGDGPELKVFTEILSGYLGRGTIIMTGLVPQREAALYLASSDVLLSPHVNNPDGGRFFGSPTKLFEYMAMGKPVIASNLEQIGEALCDGAIWPAVPNEKSDSILIAPGNSIELAQAMEWVIENGHAVQHLGRNARNKALSQYTWKRHVQEIIDGM